MAAFSRLTQVGKTATEAPARASTADGTAAGPRSTSRFFRIIIAAGMLLLISAGVGAIIWKWKSGSGRPEELSLDNRVAQPIPRADNGVAKPVEKQTADDKDGKSVAGIKAPSLPNSPYPEGDPRDQAVAWLRANNRFGPKDKLVDECVKNLASSTPGKGFQMIVGASVTKSGQATFLTSWSRQFFVFEVPAELSKQRIVNDGTPGGFPVFEPSKIAYDLGIKERSLKSKEPLVRLGEMHIDHADRLDGKKQITGRVAFEKLLPEPGQLSLRLTVLTTQDNKASEYTLGKQLPVDDQWLYFTFAPINEPKVIHGGPVPLFLEVCYRVNPDPAEVTVVSNCVAILVNVVAP